MPQERIRRAKHAILQTLAELDAPAGAARLHEHLAARGLVLQPRTIRLYLLQMDQAGLTRCLSRRRGRVLTEAGLEELGHAQVIRKVGLVSARMAALSYRQDYDLESRSGNLIVNTAWCRSADISQALQTLEPVFARGLSMGNRLAYVAAGGTWAGQTVPYGEAVLSTLCSVALNGILLRAGIPIESRFGGLLELRQGSPLRFTELIEYTGTSLDPLEAFLRAGMTRVLDAARDGNGIIGASFREAPAAAAPALRRLRQRLERAGLNGILSLGQPGQALLDIPVGEERVGLVLLGGLNPLAALHEAGIPFRLNPLAGLEDATHFSSYREILRRHMSNLRTD